MHQSILLAQSYTIFGRKYICTKVYNIWTKVYFLHQSIQYLDESIFFGPKYPLFALKYYLHQSIQYLDESIFLNQSTSYLLFAPKNTIFGRKYIFAPKYLIFAAKYTIFERKYIFCTKVGTHYLYRLFVFTSPVFEISR